MRCGTAAPRRGNFGRDEARWWAVTGLPRLRRPACRDDGRSWGCSRPRTRSLSSMSTRRARRSAIRCAPRCASVQAGAGRLRRGAGGAVRATTCISRPIRSDWLAHAKQLLRDGAPAFRARRAQSRGRAREQRRLPAARTSSRWASRCSASTLRIPSPRAAEKVGVPTLVEFFGESSARDLAGEGRRRRSDRRQQRAGARAAAATISSPGSRRC